MSAQRYERVVNVEHNDHVHASNPSSPPPSFRSRTSSITHNRPLSERQALVSRDDHNLADSFDPSDDDSDDEHHIQLDDRQLVMSARHTQPTSPIHDQPQPPHLNSPSSQPQTTAPINSTAVYGGGNGARDGVFANLSAKTEPGEDGEEKPPTYEQAAADATPPYWETTILAPGGSNSDDVFIDGLPVGSLFSFIWNGMISMSFQLVGFLLTYLLHTTHAARNGSKAGLGITLVQYGFNMKRDFNQPSENPTTPGSDAFVPPPDDPNSHDFDPNAAMSASSGFIVDGTAAGNSAAAVGGMRATDWLAYALMIVGWFILIRSISEYLKARRHEQLVLQSPSRGLNVPVVAEGEEPNSAV